MIRPTDRQIAEFLERVLSYLEHPNASELEKCVVPVRQIARHVRELVAELRATMPSQGRGTAEALRIALEVCEDAKAQWGDDYLWSKWQMSERIAQAQSIQGESP